jgi:hypothetical protein
MNQLIEILKEKPIIIAILISWPIFLLVAKVVTQKVIVMYELKNKK